MALVIPHTLERNLLFKGALERIDEVPSPKRQKRALADNTEATPFVELDLINDDESEDEGEIMLLAMILLQIHGVKLAAASAQELDQNKKKRQRTSPDQLAILEQIFQTDKMPSQQTRLHLAEQLGMSSRRVQIWFQNKRAKVKRGMNKSTELEEVSSPDDDVPNPSKAFAFSSPSSSDQLAPSSPSFPFASFANQNNNNNNNHATTLSSATLSTLSLLNSSSALVVPSSLSPLKKTQIIPMKETTGTYADATAKKTQG